jgi:glutathione S-transferase
MLHRLKKHAQQLETSQSAGRMVTENTPDITLYTAQTPNGIKIPIALEELG